MATSSLTGNRNPTLRPPHPLHLWYIVRVSVPFSCRPSLSNDLSDEGPETQTRAHPFPPSLKLYKGEEVVVERPVPGPEVQKELESLLLQERITLVLRVDVRVEDKTPVCTCPRKTPRGGPGRSVSGTTTICEFVNISWT